MENLAKAVIQVMKAVQNIEKKADVGSGSMAYKGVNDKDVKKAFNQALAKNGLCILPTDVKEETRIDRWEETNQYGTRQRQQVFTKVKTKYMLLHESGESIEIRGYGHGVDSQDKSAGKATTYALKYALLYTFLTPTGNIDDTDNEHSEEKDVPKNGAKPEKPWLNIYKKDSKELTDDMVSVSQKMRNGTYTSVRDIRNDWAVNKESAATLEAWFKKLEKEAKQPQTA